MADAWLLDTNILLRMSKSDDPSPAAIQEVIRTLVANQSRLCFIRRFWANSGMLRRGPVNRMASASA